MTTTFKSQYCTKGVSAWFRFGSGILPSRAKLRALKSEGVNWIGLTWMSELWEWVYKETKLSDPAMLIPFIETCNQTYGLRVVLRLSYERDERDKLYAGTQLRNFDGMVQSAAKVMGQVSPTMNAFQPVHEWGLVGDTFTQTALQAATTFVEGEYERWVPQIRAVAPSTTILLSPPGWGKIWSGDHLLMSKFWPNTIRAHEYPKSAQEVLDAKAYWAARSQKMMIMEAEASQMGFGLSAGVPVAEWREG